MTTVKATTLGGGVKIMCLPSKDRLGQRVRQFTGDEGLW